MMVIIEKERDVDGMGRDGSEEDVDNWSEEDGRIGFTPGVDGKVGFAPDVDGRIGITLCRRGYVNYE
jgi:hypothetical protein